MRKYVKEFIHRGLLCASCGPIILAVIYGAMGLTDTVVNLSPAEVSMGILSITVMAFIAAGITMIYQIERLPLISAILIHFGVLYLDYLLVYVVNRWIPRNVTGIGIFTVIFILGYALIWFCIYLSIRAKTAYINQKLPK